jgi:3-dehydroquinate dehydratase-2
MIKVLILNGPNINLIGIREPDVYGSISWDQIETRMNDFAVSIPAKLIFFQSNSESALIDTIHRLLKHPVDFIIFNPAGFTGTSFALRDALLAVRIPFYEVHISNVYAREQHHQISVFSDIAAGVLVGLGANVYQIALLAGKYQFEGEIIKHETRSEMATNN